MHVLYPSQTTAFYFFDSWRYCWCKKSVAYFAIFFITSANFTQKCRWSIPSICAINWGKLFCRDCRKWKPQIYPRDRLFKSFIHNGVLNLYFKLHLLTCFHFPSAWEILRTIHIVYKPWINYWFINLRDANCDTIFVDQFLWKKMCKIN